MKSESELEMIMCTLFAGTEKDIENRQKMGERKISVFLWSCTDA